MSLEEFPSPSDNKDVKEALDAVSEAEESMIMFPKGWEEVFINFKNELDEVYYILQEEIQKGKQIYPNFKDIFKTFYETSLEDVKVVIMGQEPYHNPGLANGLAFSVNKGVEIPPTLMNIYYELRNEIHGFSIPNHGDLTTWAKQGVLLLNCSLTVEKGRKITHEVVWRGLIRRIIKECSSKGGVIFVLWGKEAFNFDRYIDTSVNTILKSSHPSPYSADKGPEKERFFGCGHFKMINELLDIPIDWNL
jgi:uracil-DNA glycosylase